MCWPGQDYSTLRQLILCGLKKCALPLPTLVMDEKPSSRVDKPVPVKTQVSVMQVPVAGPSAVKPSPATNPGHKAQAPRVPVKPTTASKASSCPREGAQLQAVKYLLSALCICYQMVLFQILIRCLIQLLRLFLNWSNALRMD